MSTKKYICKPQYSVFHEVFTNMGLLHMANKRHFKALCPFSIQQPHVLPTITLWYTTKVNKCNTYLNTLHTKKNKCFTYACVRKYTKIYMHKIQMCTEIHKQIPYTHINIHFCIQTRVTFIIFCTQSRQIYITSVNQKNTYVHMFTKSSVCASFSI